MGKLKAALSKFKDLWNFPRDRTLLRSLIVLCALVTLTMGGGLGWLIVAKKKAHGHVAAHGEGHEEVAEHGEGEHGGGEEHGEEGHGEEQASGHGEEHGGGGEGEHGGGHGGGALTIYSNPIPKDIRDRRDGKIEDGHDLVDPDIESMRGLASLMKSEVKIEKANRFVQFPELMARTRAGDSFSTNVLATISVDVNSLEAENEVTKRGVEFQGLIASLISERGRDFLKTEQGQAVLKQDIQREINHLLRAEGRVTDVLFVNFFVN